MWSSHQQQLHGPPHREAREAPGHQFIIILLALLGVSLVLEVCLCFYVVTHKIMEENSAVHYGKQVLHTYKLQESSMSLCEIVIEMARQFRLCNTEVVTKNFAN
ncbi:hypothetical protein VPH35_136909 [Triticum aestivum]|uniref:Uncharacterized protein n=1 Tax=Aegilops tauschii subsp. strangulata TaxID=200361 RepID=A0A453RJ74_AEGTS